MPLAEQSHLSLTFKYTQNLIAACPTFRHDILANVSYSVAKDRVYLIEALGDPDEEEALEYPGTGATLRPALEPRPYAIVIENARSLRREGTGEWAGTGSCLVAFEVPVPAEYIDQPDEDGPEDYRQKFRDRKRWADALCGAMLADLIARAGKSSGAGEPFLNANDITVAAYPGDAEEEHAGPDYVGFAFILSWQ